MPNQELKQQEYDLYISYNTAQKSQVEYMCQLFKNANLKIWFDKDPLNDDISSNKFDQNLHALHNSYLFVCFLSKEYQKSIKNRIEYSIALEQEMKIVNIYLDDQNETKKNESSINVNLYGLDLSDLNSIVRTIKDESEHISKTFKQSFKKMINNFYKTI